MHWFSEVTGIRLLTISALMLLQACAADRAQADWVRHSDTSMTTSIELVYWAENDQQKRDLPKQVMAEFERVDLTMSRYREDSELSKVNREAADAPVPVSGPLFDVFARALETSRLSNGAFDISFGSVGYLYDYRAGVQPSAEAIAQWLPSVNYRAIRLDPEAQTIAYSRQNLRADLGGIAKGYAVDRGIAVLKAAGVRHARLSAGGDMRLLGDKRGKPWIVAIRDPRSEADNAVVLPLSDIAVSTSGDYERFFIDEDGTRVHHILSPRTGQPAQGVQSVTVLGDDALTTDALSTAVFVLGVDQGLAMINGIPGVDVIIIDEHRKMHYSRGLGASNVPDTDSAVN